MIEDKKKWMHEASELSALAIETGQGGPFGCVIVKDGKIIARGSNKVTVNNDPTAHAEVVAIREACKVLNSFQLEGCEVYTSCEPCPMCLGAIYWARPDIVYYANTKKDAAEINFDDDFIYKEILINPENRKIKMIHLPDERAKEVFKKWKEMPDKKEY